MTFEKHNGTYIASAVEVRLDDVSFLERSECMEKALQKPQTYLKRTSNIPQTQPANTSNAPQTHCNKTMP